MNLDLEKCRVSNFLGIILILLIYKSLVGTREETESCGTGSAGDTKQLMTILPLREQKSLMCKVPLSSQIRLLMERTNEEHRYFVISSLLNCMRTHRLFLTSQGPGRIQL